ncbi:MAG: methionine--tRNA ligase subunit beta [Planctomycetes bacterium]|nr:methionine--tRNA ligase subunit beta [Planctomycetota bacterium]
METVPFADFARLDLRTARIKDVAPHPNGDRLYLITLEGAEERRIVAGIRPHFTPDELVGRTVIVVWNLEPAIIRGVTSQGMLLAVSDGDAVALLTTDRPVTPGLRVK